MQYRSLQSDQIDRALFDQFLRRQVVTDCYRKVNGAWVIQPAPFIDDWSEDDYAVLVKCLRHTLETGGVVWGALTDGVLKGFASVESQPMGKSGDYLDLTSLHVSADMRGRGIGRELFLRAADWARRRNAKKLYISSHSAVETQAFYSSMGCVDAVEPNTRHIATEPYDRQLEYLL